jgi:hypothetical protein
VRTKNVLNMMVIGAVSFGESFRRLFVSFGGFEKGTWTLGC